MTKGRELGADWPKLPAQRLPVAAKAVLVSLPPSSMLERARQALSECLTIDEAKAIADEAKAMAMYAREKKGAEELLDLARRIQIRAFRRIGQILKQQADRPKLPPTPSAFQNVSIRIAGMDEAVFEKALARPDPGAPVDFVNRYVPTVRPPPAPVSKEAQERSARHYRAGMVATSVANFVSFTKTISAADAVSVLRAGSRLRLEADKISEEVLSSLEWLDEFAQRLTKKRRST